MLLFSFCLCRLALQPFWAHVFTSGLNYTAAQLVEVMKPAWVFSLCLSRHRSADGIFFILFVLWSGFSKNFFSFFECDTRNNSLDLLWAAKQVCPKSYTFIVNPLNILSAGHKCMNILSPQNSLKLALCAVDKWDNSSLFSFSVCKVASQLAR